MSIHTHPLAHPHDPHRITRTGWLRAAVLGANDGIVSIASLIVGVSNASAEPRAVVVAGVAGLAAGALSMAAGEYVSVSSQMDIEKADIRRERRSLHSQPDIELEELVRIYEARGLAPGTARLLEEPNGAGWAVIKLNTITPGDASRDPARIAGIQSAFGQVLGREYLQQFVRAARTAENVRVNPSAVARVKAELLKFLAALLDEIEYTW